MEEKNRDRELGEIMGEIANLKKRLVPTGLLATGPVADTVSDTRRQALRQ